MSSKYGEIGWIDLTVADAAEVKSFYAAVVGWEMSEVPVADYCDYCVHPTAEADPIAGICHQRGANAEMPSQWLMYVTVEDLQQSMQQCEALGGKVLVRDRDLGSHGRLSVIEDPAGAVCGLVQPRM